ncbi:MAG: TonB-dependent receptor [Bacteroidetes bacterium]|nr:TonB-dependent receptor [Bacteroidota bacterium]
MKRSGMSIHAESLTHCMIKLLRITKLSMILLLMVTVQVFAETSADNVEKGQQIELYSNESPDDAGATLQTRTISGTVIDADGEALIGVSISIKGTAVGTITDVGGRYTLSEVPAGATLVFSYIGMQTQEIPIGDQTTIDLTMESDKLGLEEVVVVGYGTKKKINLTGAVSVAGREEIENRPVANVQQALQGVVPNLFITTSAETGEPGGEMSMSIRGLQSIEGNSRPYVLVDGIPMDMNDVDPSDVESVSVLKDVASTAIYGARAAYGVILITTKSGKGSTGVSVSYSNNFARTYMLNQPWSTDALSFAHTMNHSAVNSGKAPYYDAQKLGWIEQNLANPGSATEVLPKPDGLGWDLGVEGLNASAATNWDEVIFKDYGNRQKHNLNVSGGNDKVSYYMSGGFYDENGYLKPSDDYFKRYNLDAKISAKATDWLTVSILAKYKYAQNEAPAIGWPDGSESDLINRGLEGGRTFVMLLTTRIKPTKPMYYPGTDVWTGRIGPMETNKMLISERQTIMSPRITLEPVKGWVTNVELNYRTNDDTQNYTQLRNPSARPANDGTGGSEVVWPGQQGTQYRPRTFSNTYLSPNIYSSYTRSIGRNNIHILAGYQQETYNYTNFYATAPHLLTDGIPSISTAVGTKTVSDKIGHWATQGVFGRLNYNFSEKYLLEFNFRFDGSSRFEEDDRWGFFPSVSAGWVMSEEAFYPLKDAIEVLKIRGSYGSIGNQNVNNYLYVPTMGVGQAGWLFGGQRLWSVGTPNLSSINLTWETVSTLDFGIDIMTLDNRLSATFDWYESKTGDLVGPGDAVPALLGTSVPKKNGGEITTRGWELEIAYRNRAGDFAYGFRGVLSDYRSKVTSYTNPTKLLFEIVNGKPNRYYEGMDLGEIWGLETDGLFQSVSEVDEHTIDQSYLYSGTWFPGDVRYIDRDGDGVIGIGDNTKDSSGDKHVIGNTTPRFQYGISLNASWKGLDINMLIQGVAKKDIDLRQLGTFRGPANGPLHANAYEEHLDFWRDDTSPLGANPDAYFPNPYAQYRGQNAKNYKLPTTRYLQNGAYIRLKNIQIGYTIPKNISEKVKISMVRIYVAAENLLTHTNLMMFDPESFKGRTEGYGGRPGDQYPLSRVFSVGLNVNF